MSFAEFLSESPGVSETWEACTGKSEVLINSIAGCGAFQVLVSIFVYFLANSASAFTMLLMSFGNYNPGWRCNHSPLDNRSYTFDTANTSFGRQTADDDNGGLVTMLLAVNNASTNYSDDSTQGSFKYKTEENCPLFESCNDIEFDPTSVTIVSEWGLLCDKKWIPSIIISIQMGGIFVGCFLAGHIGDAIGRKPTIYGAVLALAVINFVSIFSISWEMFATIRFFMGITMATVLSLYYVYVAEFVPEKWRSVLQGIPAWNVSSTVFTISSLALKNWRHIIIVTASIGMVGFIPVLWVPESLRWLEVKNKTDDFRRASKKVLRMNGKTLPPMEDLQAMANSNSQNCEESIDKQTYTILHLFKSGYAKYTILLSFPWLIGTGISYALRFGIKSLDGDFYTNLVISNVITIPFSVFHILMPNLLGRKRTGIIFSGLSTICLLGAAIVEFVVTSTSVKSIAVPALIFTVKVALDGVWCVLAIYSMELYPTVIRGLGMSWGNTIARLGGVLSPFLIPNTKDDAFVTYTIMAVFMFFCCGVFFKLPETKGRPLQDTYGKKKAEIDTEGVVSDSPVDGRDDQESNLCGQRGTGMDIMC